MATAQPDLDALKKGQSRLKLLRRPALRRRGVEGGVEDLVKSQALIKMKPIGLDGQKSWRLRVEMDYQGCSRAVGRPGIYSKLGVFAHEWAGWVSS
jgi:hypothetical protein